MDDSEHTPAPKICILHDWGHTIDSDVSSMEGRTAECTGPWQFMSIRILNDKHKVHSIHDDVEACFWVLYHTALRFFQTKPGSASQTIAMSIFDSDECSENTDNDGGDVHYYYTRESEAQKFHALAVDVYRVKFQSAPLTRFAAALYRYNDAFLAVGRVLEVCGEGSEEPEYADAVAALAKHAQTLADVDPIVDILDEAVGSDDWPEGNDVVRV